MPTGGLIALLLPAMLCALQAPPAPQTPPAPQSGQTARPQAPPGDPAAKSPAGKAPATPPGKTASTPPGGTAAPPDAGKARTTPPEGGSKPDASRGDKAQQASPVGVTAEPNPCLPGQVVTFTLPDGAIRCLVKGGKFGRGKEFKSDEVIDDRPEKDTTYTFEVVMPMSAADSAGKLTNVTEHREYKITVPVYAGKFPKLVTYRNPQHWHIDTVAGWIRNVVPQPDPATQILIYFQPQDDSPERVSVAITPVPQQTCSELMKTALMDAPTQYDLLEHIQQKDISQCGVPAAWATFEGIDHALPDIPTKSMVMTFVRDGRGYVISGRARASRFDQWEKLLHSLVRSFALDPAPPPKPGS